jgi:hypothetical protein
VSGKSPAQFRVDFCGRRIDASHILEFDRMINAWHPSSETSKRLDKILGVGPTLASFCRETPGLNGGDPSYLDGSGTKRQ